MQNRKLLVASLLLLVSGTAFAVDSALVGAAAQAVAPDSAVQGAAAVGQVMDKVEAAKAIAANPAEAATNAVKSKVAETVQQAIPAVEAPKTAAPVEAVTTEAGKTTATTAATAPAAAPATDMAASDTTKKVTKAVSKKQRKRRHH